MKYNRHLCCIYFVVMIAIVVVGIVLTPSTFVVNEAFHRAAFDQLNSMRHAIIECGDGMDSFCAKVTVILSSRERPHEKNTFWDMQFWSCHSSSRETRGSNPVDAAYEWQDEVLGGVVRPGVAVLANYNDGNGVSRVLFLPLLLTTRDQSLPESAQSFDSNDAVVPVVCIFPVKMSEVEEYVSNGNLFMEGIDIRDGAVSYGALCRVSRRIGLPSIYVMLSDGTVKAVPL